MSLFTEIAVTQSIIDQEMERTRLEEGFTDVHEFTERIFVDHVNEAVWFQIRIHGYLSWVSNSYPEYAAYGETLVGAEDEEEMLTYKSDRA